LLNGQFGEARTADKSTSRPLDQSTAWAEIAVRDSGPGIPAEVIPRVFDRFYRGEQARSREAGGAGLGLCIAKTIAELHGGRIEVESAPGAGSTFRVFLHLSPPSLQAGQGKMREF
jgi:signal transduction histidine kinase